MQDETAVKLDMLSKSLDMKKEVLIEILAQTKKQEEILNSGQNNEDAFELVVKDKGRLIKKLTELDNGFEKVFSEIADNVRNNKNAYKVYILGLQEKIRTVTDIGMDIENLERSNKTKFDAYMNKRRGELRKSRMSSKTVATYYNNMLKRNGAESSFFMDQKK